MSVSGKEKDVIIIEGRKEGRKEGGREGRKKGRE